MVLTRLSRQSLCLLTAGLLAGCQLGGGNAGPEEREGYFTWVDEQGRVRYSIIPASETSVSTGSHAASLAENSVPIASELPKEEEFTAENYPDGDELARKGFIREGQRQPYFTWLDAEGHVRVSYYTPDIDLDAGSRASPLNLTPATVYLPSESIAETEPVEGYDPNAFAILGIEQEQMSEFDKFSSACCQDLARRNYLEWVEGSEFGVRIDSDTTRHEFSSGESPFQLIALPSGTIKPGFVMRIRAYNHQGVFIPSLAFLDREFRVVRVVTDLVMDYTPENWRRRGFFEAWVPAFPGQGERWMIVYTRSEDLAGQTVIDTDYGPQAITHKAEGELGIATFEQ
ncbi:MalM family protein [Marinobacter sp.]|uniref:MalM family protein n=1 Tax=Marinobacter sp. TaxID=50741 RepID=UPI003565CB4C